jgi:hypothetical protein
MLHGPEDNPTVLEPLQNLQHQYIGPGNVAHGIDKQIARRELPLDTGELDAEALDLRHLAQWPYTASGYNTPRRPCHTIA